MKRMSECEILKEKNNYPKECFAESHNSNHCLCDDTKLLIIGTITPKDFDYFYCSPRNKIFGYIDEITGSNLKELKQQLNTATSRVQKDEIIDKIKDRLKANKTAFIDVMKYVIRDKNKIQSHDDTAIEYYSVDNKTLDKIKNIGIVICNNRLSQNIIAEKFNVNKDFITYIPQRGKGAFKSKWLFEIKKKLGKPL